MSYTPAKVTIDLEEYEELKKYRDFRINSKLLEFEKDRITTSYHLVLKDFNTSYQSLGLIKFSTPEIEQIVLKDWDIRFIRKKIVSL